MISEMKGNYAIFSNSNKMPFDTLTYILSQSYPSTKDVTKWGKIIRQKIADI